LGTGTALNLIRVKLSVPQQTTILRRISDC